MGGARLSRRDLLLEEGRGRRVRKGREKTFGSYRGRRRGRGAEKARKADNDGNSHGIGEGGGQKNALCTTEGLAVHCCSRIFSQRNRFCCFGKAKPSRCLIIIPLFPPGLIK